MTREKIIQRVDRYCEQHGLKPTTVCQYAVRNRSLYERIKRGKSFGFASAEALVKWIDEQEASEAAQ